MLQNREKEMFGLFQETMRPVSTQYTAYDVSPSAISNVTVSTTKLELNASLIGGKGIENQKYESVCDPARCRSITSNVSATIYEYA